MNVISIFRIGVYGFVHFLCEAISAIHWFLMQSNTYALRIGASLIVLIVCVCVWRIQIQYWIEFSFLLVWVFRMEGFRQSCRTNWMVSNCHPIQNSHSEHTFLLDYRHKRTAYKLKTKMKWIYAFDRLSKIFQFYFIEQMWNGVGGGKRRRHTHTHTNTQKQILCTD